MEILLKILKRPIPNFANSFGSLILFILLLCLTARVTYAQQKDFSFSHPPSSFYDQIDPEKLYNTLQDIASPAFMGRELGTSGNIKAVDWLDFKFRDIGLEPIFNTSFKQGFPVASYQLGETNNLTVSDSTFELFNHFVPAYFSDSDQVRAPLFWAGNMDEVNANVASGMAGKIVAIWQDSTKMGMPYAAPLEKIRKAESFGAEAVVLITPPGRKSSHSATGSPYRFEEFIQLPQKAEQTMEVVTSPFITPQSLSIPVIYASKKILPLLYNQLEDRRTSVYELRKGDLSADTVALQTSVEIQERKQAFNVVGMVEGTAPPTERKAVILGAHFDQQGLHSSGMPMLGANRNAAAVSALLEIARIVAKADQKPHHDIIFAAWNGTERNAAGLTYFLDNMPMPDESVAGVINLLEIAGSRLSDTVHVYTEMPKQHDKLQAAATQAGDVFGYKLHKRSDNDAGSGIYDFQLIPIARRNIPAMSISGGYYSLGNRVIDSADKLNYNQLYNITHFALELTWNMAHPVSSN
mgnify:CR=1 FL=1